MVRVPTHAHYMSLLSRTMQTKSMTDLYSFQATTGIKYSNYAGYGMTASNIVNMEASLSVTQNFINNNTLLDTSIKMMSKVTENIEDSVSSFKSQLNNTLSALSGLENGKPVSSETSTAINELQMVAFSGMSLLSDALNSSVAGKYIFGAGSSSAPTKFGFDSLEQFQKYYDGINIKYPTTTNANLSSRSVNASSSGNITFSHEAGAPDNEFIVSADKGFLTPVVTGGADTTGDLSLSAADNTLKASVRGAFNTISAGDTLMFDDGDGNLKAYVVDSVSADGKTIKFTDDPAVAADAEYTDGLNDNDKPVKISTSFAVGTIVDFKGSSSVPPNMQVIGIKDNGDLLIRADESYFTTMPITVEATDKWSMTSNSYYVGGSATEVFRVSDNQTITMDISANDSVFDRLFRAFGMIAQGNMVQTDADGNVTNADEVNTLVNEAMNILQSAIDNNGRAINGKNQTLSLVIAKISANNVTLDNVKSTLESVSKNLEDSVYAVKNVDKTEATAKLLEAQNSLEASYQVLTGVLNLSLLDYMK